MSSCTTVGKALYSVKSRGLQLLAGADTLEEHRKCNSDISDISLTLNIDQNKIGTKGSRKKPENCTYTHTHACPKKLKKEWSTEKL